MSAPDVAMRWTLRLPSGEERTIRVTPIGDDGLGFFPERGAGWTQADFDHFRAVYNEFLRRVNNSPPPD